MNPSLLLIPDRYKKDKLYSQIPDSGAGDLTFARNSDATRVNSAGLIEKVRTNVKIQSEALTTAAGGLSFTDITTITANTTETLDPFGTSKAEKFDGTIGQVADTYDAISTFVPNTSSIYAKAGTASSFDLRMSGAFSAAANAVFNLSNGTVTSSGGGDLISSKIEFVGNGWYRCSISYNFTSTPTNRIALTANGNVYFFGWQLEATDFGATPYIPTTTAAVSVGITADIPRLDYTGGGCPSLLLEPQRTNLLLQSENLSSATWTKDGGSVTANATASPDGYTNADLFTEDTSSGNHRLYQSTISTSVNQPLSFSVFAKSNGRQYIYLRTDVGTVKTAFFDIQNGTAGAVTSGATSKIESYGNGWYRLTIIVDALVATAAVCEGLVGLLNDSLNSSYAGNGTSGAYFWGFQGEANTSYPTSYIPTLGSSVTRLADAASKTGISSLIGQTEGTMFLDINLNTDGSFFRVLLNLKGVNAADYITINTFQTTGNIYADINNTQVLITSAVNSGRCRIALAYKNNDVAFYINGTLIGTSNLATIPATSEIGFNDPTTSGVQRTSNVNNILLFKTRLTNAQLQSLTAL